MKGSGSITRQHTVWCGSCSTWEGADIDHKSEAVALFKRMGWRTCDEVGWECPACSKFRRGEAMSDFTRACMQHRRNT